MQGFYGFFVVGLNKIRTNRRARNKMRRFNAEFDVALRQSLRWSHVENASLTPQAHDDVASYKRFLSIVAFCEGNPLVAGGSLHNGPVTRVLIFS